MSRQRTHPKQSKVMSGLQAQLERVSKFQDTIDPAASLATYARVLRLLDAHLDELRAEVGLSASPRCWPASAPAR